MKSFLFKDIKKSIKTFSLTEKAFYYIFLAIFIVTGFLILDDFNQRFLVEVPMQGGTLNEGLVGTPRLINPILAVSETDRDLTSLIYSGLMRANPDNTLSPDLAEGYEVSEDGLEYTFYIKEAAEFHDGEPVTADDVIFTIISAQNPELKSPRRSNWEGISIEKVNDRQLIFRLKQPYTPFLQNMTLGILPKHIWGEIDINEFALSNFNVEPIGSGPYQIEKIKRDSIGIPESYHLSAFDDFVLGTPYIANINLHFAKNQEALLALYEKGQFESMHAISPMVAADLEAAGHRIEHFTLPRTFGVFFNQDEATVLSSNAVRRALEIATPKQKIIDEVFSGFGKTIDGPIPENLVNIISDESISEESAEMESMTDDERISAARLILEEAGWEEDEEGNLIREESDETKILSFSVTTGNVPELVSSAKIVVEAWERIGAKVDLKIFEPSDLNSNVIRPRKYDALLFGMITGRDLDFYAFWHSSQRNDPGLNIAKYANIDADKILEDIRETENQEILLEKFRAFNEEVRKDVPAVFLYTPEFIYVLPDRVKGFEITDIITSEERFLNIYKWYIDTDKIWRIFNKD